MQHQLGRRQPRTPRDNGAVQEHRRGGDRATRHQFWHDIRTFPLQRRIELRLGALHDGRYDQGQVPESDSAAVGLSQHEHAMRNRPRGTAVNAAHLKHYERLKHHESTESSRCKHNPHNHY